MKDMKKSFLQPWLRSQCSTPVYFPERQAKGGCQQFIMMSSAGVYGPTDVLPLSESTPGDPNSRHKDGSAAGFRPKPTALSFEGGKVSQPLRLFR